MKAAEDRARDAVPYAAVHAAIDQRSEQLREQVKARWFGEVDWELSFRFNRAAVAEEAVFWAAELARVVEGIAARFPQFAPALHLVVHYVQYGSDFDAPECARACRIGSDSPGAVCPSL